MEYKFKLDSSKFTITPEGFLDCVGACARIGNQTYHEDGEPFVEFRPEDEVFHPDSLESHKLKPITIRHPDALVDSENFQMLTVGVTGVVPRKDGDFLLNDFRVMDKDAVRGILDRRDRGQSTEISMGYDRVLDKKTGEFRGQKYDGIQRNIRINHAALLDEGQARAGAGAKLRLDNNENNELALYLLDQGKGKYKSLWSINVDKKVFKTIEDAKKAAGEFGNVDKAEEGLSTFQFRQNDSEKLKEGNIKIFSVPGKQGISLLFGALKDEGTKTMPKLIRKAIKAGTFRMDALEGDYHKDSETIIKALTNKLDEAVETINTLVDEAGTAKGEKDKLQAKADEMEKENKKLTADNKELSDVNSIRVQKMITDRSDLEAVAGCFKIDCKGKSDSDIKDAIILADDKDLDIKDKSEDYKQARYDMIAARAKKDEKAFDSSKQSFGEFRKNAQESKGKEKKDSRAEFAKKSAEAWKTKKAA
jgi:hypothetical protein